MEELKACPQEAEALDILESMLDVSDLKVATLTGIPSFDKPTRIGTCRISDDDATILRQYIATRRAAPGNKPLTCEGCVNRGGGLGYLACDGCCRKFPDRYEARRPEAAP